MLRTEQGPGDVEINRYWYCWCCPNVGFSLCTETGAREWTFPQLSWKGSQVPMEARRKPWIPAINYTNTWHYKNYFSTSNIKSFVRSAITLSVISTLELFEAVTDGGRPCQVFLQVRIWATGEGSVRAAREGKGRVTEVMKLELMWEAWQKN